MLFTSLILRPLANRLSRGSCRSPRPARRGRARPRFELLEDRSLLSASGLWVSGGDTVDESAGQVVFTIGCSATAEDEITVEYRTVDNPAAAGSDYDLASGILTFSGSSPSPVNITVSIVDDLFTEDDEGFYLELFNAANAPISSSQADATIRASDRPPVLDAISDQSVDEEQQLTFAAFAYDPDDAAETIVYSLDAGAPSGAMINSSDGSFSWLPTEADGPGTFTVTVVATESVSGMSASATLTISVNEVNAAPTASVLSDVTVDEDASDTVIDLCSAFNDAEDGAGCLNYSIVDNSDPSLFDAVSIDSNGQLTLDYAADAWGWSTLTVRATDSGGLSVETTLSVIVNAVNDAPIVSNFALSQVRDDTWIVSGHVSDVDDDVSYWSVSFGGVLTTFSVSASVDSVGDFSCEVELAGIAAGAAEASVMDFSGLESNIATALIFA